MSAYFFETSALVKCYIIEPGSAWVRQLGNALDLETNERSNQVSISQIAIVEAAAAFAILVRRGLISKREGKDAYDRFIHDVEREYRVVNLTPSTVERAAQLTQQHPLKAYDAIQLAVGLSAGDVLRMSELTLVFVTSDNALLQAAQAEGLTTENPYDHSDLDSHTK
jgi:predicted nucleic acid-binding protein